MRDEGINNMKIGTYAKVRTWTKLLHMSVILTILIFTKINTKKGFPKYVCIYP